MRVWMQVGLPAVGMAFAAAACLGTSLPEADVSGADDLGTTAADAGPDGGVDVGGPDSAPDVIPKPMLAPGPCRTEVDDQLDGTIDEVSEYTYDTAGRLVHELILAAESRQPIGERAYQYDDAGRCVKWTSEGVEHPGVSMRVFDPAGQLVERLFFSAYEEPWLSPLRELKRYDVHGNVVAQDTLTSLQDEWTYQKRELYSYDSDGRLSRREVLWLYLVVDYEYTDDTIVEHWYETGSPENPYRRVTTLLSPGTDKPLLRVSEEFMDGFEIEMWSETWTYDEAGNVLTHGYQETSDYAMVYGTTRERWEATYDYSCWQDPPTGVPAAEPATLAELIDAEIVPYGDKVTIPAGPAWIGCDPDLEGGCWHAAELVDAPEFAIDRTETTVAAYSECVDAGACTPPALAGWAPHCNSALYGHEHHPVNCVTYAQAEAFCNWQGGSLCTEVQWEKAARGGCELYDEDCQAQSLARTQPWGDEPVTCELAVTYGGLMMPGCGTGGTQPGGSRPAGASPYGVLDMAGNVDEWVVRVFPHPPGPPNIPPEARVLRGGHFGGHWGPGVGAPRPGHSDGGLAGRAVGPGDFESTVVGFRCCSP